jgi:hypothetical protein
MEQSGHISVMCSQIVAYAGDVVVIGRKIQDVEELYISLVEQTNKIR